MQKFRNTFVNLRNPEPGLSRVPLALLCTEDFRFCCCITTKYLYLLFLLVTHCLEQVEVIVLLTTRGCEVVDHCRGVSRRFYKVKYYVHGLVKGWRVWKVLS